MPHLRPGHDGWHGAAFNGSLGQGVGQGHGDRVRLRVHLSQGVEVLLRVRWPQSWNGVGAMTRQRCHDCGAPWVPVRRGECNLCGSDASPIAQEGSILREQGATWRARAVAAEARVARVEAEIAAWGDWPLAPVEGQAADLLRSIRAALDGNL